MKNNTVMGRFGKSTSVNAVNTAARQIKPRDLPSNWNKMTRREQRNYLRGIKKMDRLDYKSFKAKSKVARTNAKTVMSDNVRQAKMMHGTIRQGLAEIGTLAAQTIGSSAISKAYRDSSAIAQNTTGGTQPVQTTEKGPVYAHREREEE